MSLQQEHWGRLIHTKSALLKQHTTTTADIHVCQQRKSASRVELDYWSMLMVQLWESGKKNYISFLALHHKTVRPILHTTQSALTLTLHVFTATGQIIQQALRTYPFMSELRHSRNRKCGNTTAPTGKHISRSSTQTCSSRSDSRLFLLSPSCLHILHLDLFKRQRLGILSPHTAWFLTKRGISFF